MKHQELGTLDAPVLLFGGPYSNLQAAQALIAEAERLGLPARQMICTGDIVAYCADAAATVSAIRALGCTVVAGNCEKQLSAYQMDCGCGFDPGTTCDLLSSGWYTHADRQIDAEDRAWMATLPDMVTFSHMGRRCAVIHGGATDISRFVWEVSEKSVFLEEIEAITAVAGHVDMVVAGHSGLDFSRRIDAVQWLNAGVIGLPPHDGGTETRYLLLEGSDARFCHLRYDHSATYRAMQQAGLTQGYDAALLSGVWPSEEVLPCDLRRAALANG